MFISLFSAIYIYLIGFSGTGKTRSGRLLAELLGWPFVEMDGIIEDRVGKPIPSIFEENGEEDFENSVLTLGTLYDKMNSFIETACINAYEDNLQWKEISHC